MKKSKTLSVVHEVPTFGPGGEDDALHHHLHRNHPHYQNSQPGDVSGAGSGLSGLVTTPERNQLNYQKSHLANHSMVHHRNAVNAHMALDARHSEPCPDAGGGGDGDAVHIGANRSLPYPLVKQNANDSTSSRFFSASSSMHSISENSAYSSVSNHPDEPRDAAAAAAWNGHVVPSSGNAAAAATTTSAASTLAPPTQPPPKMLTSSVSSTALLSSACGAEDLTANGVVSTGNAGGGGNNNNNNGVRLRGKPVALRQQQRRHSISDISKRLSLPADLKIPDRLLIKESFSQLSLSEGPLSRRARRTSLTEIGFGKMESYVKLEKLGEGTYATVFKGKSRLTEDLVALKEIRLEWEEGAPCTAIREVSLLRDLKHANIVTLHDIIHTEKSLCLVFEYLDRDLKQYMDQCGGLLAMHNVRLFLFQLLRGLSYCHRRRVLHRDLKPQNLLINAKGELKLADFGLARAKSVPTKTYSNEVVTLWYRPPDVLLGSTEYSCPIDLWGVGCIFFEMSAGRPLFPGSTVEDELHLIFKLLGTPTAKDLEEVIRLDELEAAYDFPKYSAQSLVHYAPRLDPSGLALLSLFLRYDARRRIDAFGALKHDFFAHLPPEVHALPDTDSIFGVKGVRLAKDPGGKSLGAMSGSGVSGNKRRQSMLF